jgi:hypothetical protein
MKKDDQKAYPEVAPHCPLEVSICCVGSKSVVGPASGRRVGAIAPTDLARVVYTHKVIQDTIDLPLMVCAPEHGVPP